MLARVAARVALVLAAAGLLLAGPVGDTHVPPDKPSPPPLPEFWRFVPTEGLVTQGPPMNATTITAGGPGFVAGGTLTAEGNETAQRTAAIWVSRDGIEWRQVDPPEFLPIDGTDTDIRMLLRRGTQLIAIGKEEGVTGQDGTTLTQIAIWTSYDGIEWSRVPQSAITYPPNSDTMVLGLTSATADDHKATIFTYFDGKPYIWHSDSGRNWKLQRLNLTSVCRSCVIDKIRATTHGLFALGRDGDGGYEDVPDAVVLLLQPDGEILDFSNKFEKSAMFVDAASIEWLTIFIGYRQPPPSEIIPAESLPESATTVYGDTWTQSLNFQLPDSATRADVSDIVTAGETIIALGALSVGGDIQPAIWTSRGGVDWTATPLTQFADGGQLSSAATSDNRVVVIASSGYGPDQVQNGIFINF